MRTLLLIALLTLTVASTAQAALVTGYEPGSCYKSDCSPGQTTLVAAPGERNDVRVEATQSGVTIRDAGAPLFTRVPACRQVDEHTVACPSAPVTAELGDEDDRAEGVATVLAGDGDDVVTKAGTARGDAGDDVLEVASSGSGGPGNDRVSGRYSLFGGDGDDVLTGTEEKESIGGGAGADRIDAAGGDDRIVDTDTGGGDQLFGGQGRDLLTFADRADPVAVDLERQTSSDGDVLGGFEGAIGGLGDDTLTGSEGADQLIGAGGNDVLTGRGGNDELDGGAGFDRFDAGAGDDRLLAGGSGSSTLTAAAQAGFDAGPEALGCGDGADLVVTIDDDLPGADCERLRQLIRPAPLSVRRLGATFRIGCPRDMRSRGRCRGTLRVTERREGNLTGYDPERAPSTRFAVGSRGGRVSVVLPETAQVVTVTVRFDAGFATSWRVVLRPGGQGSPGG